MTRAEAISGCGMPPMKPIIEQIMGQMHTEYENGVMRAVQSYDFNVDKDRLTQALTDARAFYEEGYRAALREQEQREQGCLYCDGTEGDLYFHEGACPQMNDVVYISGNQIHCDFGCKAWGAFGIKFCPMCGRRLED